MPYTQIHHHRHHIYIYIIYIYQNTNPNDPNGGVKYDLHEATKSHQICSTMDRWGKIESSTTEALGGRDLEQRIAAKADVAWIAVCRSAVLSFFHTDPSGSLWMALT